MKLQDQVVSLELAKKLKELGVKQESLFYWRTVTLFGESKEPWVYYGEKNEDEVTIASAYLASELGELLPRVIKNTVEDDDSGKLEDWFLSYEPDKIGHTVRYTYYYYEPMDTITIGADTECNARAKMLIHLIENHLISVEELGK